MPKAVEPDLRETRFSTGSIDVRVCGIGPKMNKWNITKARNQHRDLPCTGCRFGGLFPGHHVLFVGDNCGTDDYLLPYVFGTDREDFRPPQAVQSKKGIQFALVSTDSIKKDRDFFGL